MKCGLKPFLRAWKPLRGWGVRVKGGLKCGLKPFLRAWKPLRGWDVRAKVRGLKCRLMVFEYIIRHSPCRRASPRIAEGFSPTARVA